MSWAPRTRTEIRDSLLADWAARALAASRPIIVDTGSYAWLLAGAIALIVEAQEAQLDALARELLPDTATTTFLDRHGALEQVTRVAATRAVLQLTLTGTATKTIAFGSSTLLSSDGTVYTPSANADGTGTGVTFDGSGNATAYATAQLTGSAGNLAVGTTLAWSSTPTFANPTGTVAAISVTGTDRETDASYAVRIIARRQERPASGNRADWAAWTTAVTGVDDAVVYPLLHATYGVNTLGAVTVIPLGPAQGDSTTNTRIVSGTITTRVANYIEGTVDADGNAVAAAAQVQLRPVTMASGDYSIEAATGSSQNLDLTVTLAGDYAAPFAYVAGYVVLATSTASFIKIAGNHTASGTGEFTTSRDILVNVGTANYRGGYYQTRPTAVSYNGGTGNTELTVPAMPAAPTVGSTVMPGLANWADIRTALFTLFDALGPGDTSPAARWPGEDSRLRATLYRSAIAAALVARYDADGALQAGVAGVVNVVVNTPVADVTPAAKTIVTLGTMAVHP